MAGDVHGAETQEAAQDERGKQAAQKQSQVSGVDWEKAIAERDGRIAELEQQAADAAKNAEAAEALCGEIAELKAQGESDRIDFQLQLAGVRNVKAARAALADHNGDADALKEAEPWLFADAPVSKPLGDTTGLLNTGTSSDEGKTMRRWSGSPGWTIPTTRLKEGRHMANSIAFAKNYTAIIDEAYQRDGIGRLHAQRGCKIGSITYEFETKTFNYDRGIRLFADVMDVEEADVLDCFVEAGSELMRTQVAPEADAFTFAQIAGHAGVIVANEGLSKAKPTALLESLRTVTSAMDEAQVSTGGVFL